MRSLAVREKWQSETRIRAADQLQKTPHTYAYKLASYIRDPSTIIAYTKREWGTSPDRDEVERMIAHHRRPAPPSNYEASLDGEANDHLHFQVRGLVKPEIIYQPKLPKLKAKKPEKKQRKPNVKAKPEPVYNGVGMADLSHVKMLKGVATDFAILATDLTGPRRCKKMIHARAIVIYILRERNGSVWSFPRIGKLLGGRDHSTIINLWQQRDELLAIPHIKACYDKWKAKMYSGDLD